MRNIQLYISHIKEELLSFSEIKHSYYNLTREDVQSQK